MDIAELGQPAWVFKSERSGDWHVRYYSSNAMIALDDSLRKYDDADPIEHIRAVMGEVLYKSETHGEKEVLSSPTKSELNNFTIEEIERFSKGFLDNNSFQVATSEIVSTDDKKPSTDLLAQLKAENQSFSRSVSAGIADRLKTLKASNFAGLGLASEALRKQAEGLNLSQRLSFNSPALAALAMSQSPSVDKLKSDLGLGKRGLGRSAATDSLEESSLGSFSTVDGLPVRKWPDKNRPFIDIPVVQNPALETNRHLKEMNDRVEKLISAGEDAVGIIAALQLGSGFITNR